MANRSSDKGHKFEIEISRYLSLWFSKGKKDDLYWRSAGSGNIATIGLSRGKRLDKLTGDISSIGGEGEELTRNFMVECKFYKDLEYDSLIFNVNRGICGFWNKLVKDAKKFSKLPMLIARQNRRPTLIGLDLKTFYLIEDNAQKPFTHASVYVHQDLCLTLTRDFFSRFKSEDLGLMEIHRKQRFAKEMLAKKEKRNDV